jgi:hypothetical protein
MKCSPCKNCPERLPGYACIDHCKKPAKYAAMLGGQCCGIPDNMTHMGKSLRYLEPLVPHTEKLLCKNDKACNFPGCKKTTNKFFCLSCEGKIRNRIRLNWPLRIILVPTERKRLSTVLKDEKKYMEEPWYNQHQDKILALGRSGRDISSMKS